MSVVFVLVLGSVLGGVGGGGGSDPPLPDVNFRQTCL